MGPAGTARGAADVRGTADVRMDTGAVVRMDTGAVVQKSGIVVTVTVTVTLVKTVQKTMSATISGDRAKDAMIRLPTLTRSGVELVIQLDRTDFTRHEIT